jgi:hypothetical protein
MSRKPRKVSRQLHKNLNVFLVRKLCELLENGQEMLTIVFTETKKGADYLDHFLHERGYQSTCIHGDRNQQEREEAVHLFKVCSRKRASRLTDFRVVKHQFWSRLPSPPEDWIFRMFDTLSILICQVRLTSTFTVSDVLDVLVILDGQQHSTTRRMPR